MGYRSDVAYVIKFKTIEERDAYVTYMSAKNDEHIKQALTEVDFSDKEDPIITFKAENVKWYNGYPSVEAHKFIYSHAHELEVASFRFIAVGEDGQEECEEEVIAYIDNLHEYLYAVHRIETSF